MAKRKKLKRELKISRATVALVATVIVAIITVGGIMVAGSFIFQTLEGMSAGAFRLSEEDGEAIETIDIELLSELKKKIEAKNALDEPREGKLRNPFAERKPDAPPAPTAADIMDEPPMVASPIQ